MNHTQKIIEDAIKGGWNDYPAPALQWLFDNNAISEEKALLDPSFWKAVGKTRGWKPSGVYSSNVHRGIKDGYWRDHQWKISWHRFIDHLADGLTIEEALSKLSE